MASSPAGDSREIYRFSEFFDRLENDEVLDVRDAVESETEIDGIVYHHRGVQVPAYTSMFTWNGDTPTPTFSIELSPVGPREAWATFDATKNWDVYLVLFDGGAVIAWMTDAEFESEEADQFSSKAAAIQAGQFSFGAFFRFGPDWVEREDWALESNARAMVQLGDGRIMMPADEDEFFQIPEAVPVELHDDPTDSPPEYLGLVDAKISID